LIGIFFFLLVFVEFAGVGLYHSDMIWVGLEALVLLAHFVDGFRCWLDCLELSAKDLLLFIVAVELVGDFPEFLKLSNRQIALQLSKRVQEHPLLRNDAMLGPFLHF